MSSAAGFYRQRCFHHEAREAVCRCLGCSHSFCRECVVDHDGRLMCASCLQARSGPAAAPSRMRSLRSLVYAFAGVLAAWIFFYTAGRVVVSIALAWDDWRPR